MLTMFRVESRLGAEITDQGVSKQLRCRQEVRPNSVRLEVTARRRQGLRPAAGCGRGSRLTGSALSPPANGRPATSATARETLPYSYPLIFPGENGAPLSLQAKRDRYVEARGDSLGEDKRVEG